MKVQVIDRGNGVSYQLPKEVIIEISDKCPKCGGKRGEPRIHHFYEDGNWYTCHIWDNLCGHVDGYSDCLKEANHGS